MNEKYKKTGLLIGGFTMLGMATGWLIGDIKIGLFIGVGLGMVISAFSQMKKNEDE